jgi:polysaccharide export outer membrane protein
VTAKLAGLNILLMERWEGRVPECSFEHVTILEAIANSGDIVTGNRKAVTIIRKTPTGTEMRY